MSASGLVGAWRLSSFLFTSTSSRIAPTSAFCSSSSWHFLLEPSVRFFASNSLFKREERLKTVINLLKQEGFTDAHLLKIKSAWPQQVLLSDPKTCILPKLEFFRSLGCSNGVIVTLFSRSPNLLTRSLEDRIVPCYDIIKSVLLIDSKVMKSFECNLSRCSLDPKILTRNVQEMRDHGLPDSSISMVLRHYVYILFQSPSKFRGILNELERMRFDPSENCFISGMRVFATMTKGTVESKMDALERFGLRRDEAWTVFKKQPLVMCFKEEKIMKVMDFLLTQMRWKSEDIVSFPIVFLLNLEKRIIPRCFVAHVLVSKGLKKKMRLSSFLCCSEELFLERYVTNNQVTVPQLLDLYRRKVTLSDLCSEPF